MRAYAYTAYTDGGRRKTGTVIADTESQASADLKAQGLYVEDLSPQDGVANPRACRLAKGHRAAPGSAPIYRLCSPARWPCFWPRKCPPRQRWKQYVRVATRRLTRLPRAPAPT